MYSTVLYFTSFSRRTGQFQSQFPRASTVDVGGAGLIEDGWKNRRTHHEENADKSLTTRKFLVSTVRYR